MKVLQRYQRDCIKPKKDFSQKGIALENVTNTYIKVEHVITLTSLDRTEIMLIGIH